MASIQQILELEASLDARTLRLWQEGIFYKAYECSAYLFVSEIRAYAPRKRYVKSLQRSVVSIGFPMSALASLPLPSGAELIDEPNAKLIRISADVDLSAYEAWHSSLAEHKAGEERSSLAGSADLCSELLRRLSSFRLESATPLDCMSFVAELRDYALSRFPQ